MHVMLPFAEALHATCYGHSDAKPLALNDVFGMKQLTVALINKMLQHAAAIDASITGGGGAAKTAASRLATVFMQCGAPVVPDEYEEGGSGEEGADAEESRRGEEGAETGFVGARPARRATSSSTSGEGSASLRGVRSVSADGVLGTDSTSVRVGSAGDTLTSVKARSTEEDGSEADPARRVENAKVAVNAIAAAVAAGVWVPVEIVIARPFIQHLMLSAIVAVAGSKTGATLFGPADSAPPASMHCTHTHTQRAHIQRSRLGVAAQCNCRPTRLSRPSRVRRVLSRTRVRLSALHSLSVERANRGAQATTRAIFITRTHKR